MNSLFINLVGYAAAALGTFLMLPQVIKSFREKTTRDVAMGMIVLYVGNCFLWLAYGLLISSMPLVLSNAIGFLIGLTQLGLKVKYDPAMAVVRR